MAQKEGTPTARVAIGGAIAGLIGAAAMAMYAMVAGATYQGSGFFTPMYHIASTVIGPSTMETSMQRAMEGQTFYLEAGPAALGLLLHMTVGAAFGVIFGALVSALRVRGGAALASGLVYGIAVMLIMSFVALPLVAGIAGGEPIAKMPTMVGWATFTIEHALFGFVLGLWPLVRPHDLGLEVPETAARVPSGR